MASAGLQVAIAQISSAVELAVERACLFHRSATFSSPRRFFEPEGDQSAPRQMRTPAARAASTSVVSR